MGIYFRPTPPHSGLTGLQGGDGVVGEFYHLTQDQYDYVSGLYSGVTSISATTIYSGSTDIGTIFGPSTFVQSGINITTGGTASRPIINVIGSPVFTAVTASSVSGTSISATTLFSGSTNLGALFGPSTFVAPGVNAYTGGTATRPIVGVIGSPVFTAVTASSVSGTSISATTLFSGSTSLQSIFDGKQTRTDLLPNHDGRALDGHAFPIYQETDGHEKVTGSQLLRYVDTNFGLLDFSEDDKLRLRTTEELTDDRYLTLLVGDADRVLNITGDGSIEGANTGDLFVQPGTNIATGGTAYRPIVSVIGSPVFTAITASSISGSSISATTIFSGNTNIGSLFGPSTFVAPGVNAYTGGTSSRPIVGVIGSPIFTAVTASSISGTSISATTFFSGSSELSGLFGPSTFVVPGVNAYTGGTASRPIVGVIGSPVFTAVTASSVSGTSVSATTFFSGNSDLSGLFGPSTFVSPGVNAYTGGTASRPIVGVIGSPVFTAVTASSVSGTSVSATTIFSGSSDLSGLFGPSTFVAPGVNAYTGGTASRPIIGVVGSPVFTAVTASSVSGTSISATTFFSGSTDLSTLFGQGTGSPTYVKPGVNITTGGTPSAPVINVVGSPVFTAVTASSVSGTSVSATTFFSGSSDLSGLFGPSTFVAPGVNAYTGGTPSRPIVGVVGSPVFTAVTASSVSGTSVSATTLFSGSTNIGSLFGPSTFVAPGVNAYTGGTATRPIVGVIGSPVFTAVTASSVSGTSISGASFYSGSTSFNDILSSLSIDTSRTYKSNLRQASHGLSIGSLVYIRTNGEYTVANSNSLEESKVVGMVTDVIDADSFELTTEGYCDLSLLTTILPALAQGVTYYLTKTPGVLNPSPPTDGGLIKPVFVGIDASAFYLWNGTAEMSSTGFQISTGNTSSIRTLLGLATNSDVTFNSLNATSSVIAASISATTFFSGSANLGTLFGPSTFVAPGVNAYTGGTPSRPIIGVIGSPVFTAVTASSVSGTSVSATTIFSGSNDLGSLFGPSTFITPGLNAYTGGTAIRPIVGVIDSPTFTAVTVSSLTASQSISTFNLQLSSDVRNPHGSILFKTNNIDGVSGTTNLVWNNNTFGVGGAITANTISGLSVSGTSVSATTFFSGSTDLSTFFGQGTGTPTYVKPGVNISTGGTPSAPVINVVGSPVFTAVTASEMSGTSVSATTFFSGSTDLSTFFGQGTGSPTYVKPGVNITTGGTPSAPVINVVGSPVFTAVTASSVSGTSVSATTFFSGSTDVSNVFASKTHTHQGGILFSIDAGGSVISTGQKGYVIVPYNGIITGWTIVSNVVGSIVIDVWRDSYANFPPTLSDTIAGSEKPTLSSQNKAEDTNLTTWTTTFSAGDVFTINVDSVSTINSVTLVLGTIKLS